MRATTSPQPCELPDELKDDPWLLWLREHAHEDLWMPRVPLAVIERIRQRHTGQRRTTLINVWIGIRRLLLSLSLIRGNMLSVREIAEWSGVSRSRLCGDAGYIQNLLDAGVIGVTVLDDQPLLSDRYNGRALYHIDMAALETESLVLLRDKFSEARKSSIPRRPSDPRQGSLPMWSSAERPEQADEARPVSSGARELPALAGSPSIGTTPSPTREATLAPAASRAAPNDTAPIPIGARSPTQLEPHLVPLGASVVPSETGAAPCDTACSSHPRGPVPPGTVMVSSGATVVPPGAVGMEGIGMEGKGGEGEECPLTRKEMTELIPAIVQQAVTLLSAQQQTMVAGGSVVSLGPNTPKGEPAVQRWPKELWTLYKRGACDPLELDRLALLPAFFDEPSGGHGAYWVSRAILMLTEGERAAPITVPYLRGVLERMRRAGEWSTARLEAPAEEHDRTPTHGRERGRTAAANPPLPPRAVVPAAAAAPVASTTAPAGERTALTIFRQYANGTKLLPEQERQIAERVHDLEIWEVVCANWRENGWKFDSVDKMLHRYATLMSERIKEQPATGPRLSKLERAIHEIPGLSDEERARYCEEMMQYVPDDRKRFVEDLRRRCAARSGAEVSS